MRDSWKGRNLLKVRCSKQLPKFLWLGALQVGCSKCMGLTFSWKWPDRAASGGLEEVQGG